MGRILALDLGEKRVGVALSDPTQTIAQPLETILYSTAKALISYLFKILEKYEIEKIIVGHPLTLKGKSSHKTLEIEKIFNKLKLELTIPMQLFDERLTTILAHGTMRQLDKKPSMERDKIDQLAAMHLLQNYLDREFNLRNRNSKR
jgi:putative Holliday junction resolvase